MTKVSVLGSFVLVVCIGATYILMEPNTETAVIASMAAKIIGLGIVLNILIEYSRSMKNLLRADMLAILGIYVLTLYEFLFEQKQLSHRISPDQAYGGLELILIGLLFFVIGRHLFTDRSSVESKMELRLNIKLLLALFYLCFFIGFLYILITVNFNPYQMIRAAMRARFSQPWARGRLGGSWIVLLSELKLFTYAIPPLAGILLNYRKKMSVVHVVLVLLLLLTTIFMSFAGGTRNVFFSYLIGFIGGYFLSKPRLEVKKLILPGLIFLMVAYTAATYMVQFRSIGLTKFLSGYRDKGVDPDQIYVDHNLRAIGLLSQFFPREHDFLGMEVFTWALIKPIPRVMWPDKPEGLTVSIEEVAKVGEGFTLAATYIGESYMAGGIPAIIIVSLLFGYMATWWNTKAQSLNNEKLLIYALGLFAVVITMRSMFMLTTAILPVIGVSVLMRYLNRGRKRSTH